MRPRARTVFAGLALAVTACGRVSFRDIGADTSLVDAADGDATLDLGLDAALAPAWSTPVPLTELVNGVANQDPTVTGDGLELYFSSGRTPACGGQTDIWLATRTTTSALWSAPTCVVELSSNRADVSPEISADGLTLYLSSDRIPTLGARDIYISTRANRSSAWSVPARVAIVSTAANELNLALTSDGDTMIIDSDTDGDRDLYLSTRSGGNWSAPIKIASLETVATEGGPGLDVTGRWLYFSRGVEADQTSFDIFVSERVNGVFGAATLVPTINSSVQDGDPFLQPDGTLWLSSTRSGTVDLYRADP